MQARRRRGRQPGAPSRSRTMTGHAPGARSTLLAGIWLSQIAALTGTDRWWLRSFVRGGAVFVGSSTSSSTGSATARSRLQAALAPAALGVRRLVRCGATTCAPSRARSEQSSRATTGYAPSVWRWPWLVTSRPGCGPRLSVAGGAPRPRTCWTVSLVSFWSRTFRLAPCSPHESGGLQGLALIWPWFRNRHTYRSPTVQGGPCRKTLRPALRDRSIADLRGGIMSVAYRWSLFHKFSASLWSVAPSSACEGIGRSACMQRSVRLAERHTSPGLCPGMVGVWRAPTSQGCFPTRDTPVGGEVGVSRGPVLEFRLGISWNSPGLGPWARQITSFVEPAHSFAGTCWAAQDVVQVLRRSGPSRRGPTSLGWFPTRDTVGR